MFRTLLEVPTPGRGLHDISVKIAAIVDASGVRDGLCHLFVQHTSCSLVVQENADPEVRSDLVAWFSRAVPDGDPLFKHVDEGPDDMPSHVRAALTAVSVTLPIGEGRVLLGRWQAIYLFEHRLRGSNRRVVVSIV